jgi:hypothetical protein
MIIGLHGLAQSGKDTIFKIASEFHDGQVLRRAFADPLKLSALRVFKPDATVEEALEWADQMKAQGYVDAVHDTGEGFHLTGRQLLQNYGTEAHREVFGMDFWVDASLPRWDGMGHTESGIFGIDRDRDLLFFTDVRFINEAERIREWNGEIWHVVRDAVKTGDTHASEQTLPESYIDATIYNNGTLDDLIMSVRKMLMIMRSLPTSKGVV